MQREIRKYETLVTWIARFYVAWNYHSKKYHSKGGECSCQDHACPKVEPNFNWMYKYLSKDEYPQEEVSYLGLDLYPDDMIHLLFKFKSEYPEQWEWRSLLKILLEAARFTSTIHIGLMYAI